MLSAKPAKRGPNFNVIGAMRPAGLMGDLLVQGAVFEMRVEHVLAATLATGDRVWRDNL